MPRGRYMLLLFRMNIELIPVWYSWLFFRRCLQLKIASGGKKDMFNDPNMACTSGGCRMYSCTKESLVKGYLIWNIPLCGWPFCGTTMIVPYTVLSATPLNIPIFSWGILHRISVLCFEGTHPMCHYLPCGRLWWHAAFVTGSDVALLSSLCLWASL